MEIFIVQMVFIMKNAMIYHSLIVISAIWIIINIYKCVKEKLKKQ